MNILPNNQSQTILYYRKDKASQPVIPTAMSQHIFKKIREGKNEKLEPLVFHPPNPDENILTGPNVIPFDDFEGKIHSKPFTLSEELFQEKPFMRKVIYLTNETLPEAFELLNRVSASRLLFDANIKVSIQEDKEKSLWYLEVIT